MHGTHACIFNIVNSAYYACTVVVSATEAPGLKGTV